MYEIHRHSDDSLRFTADDCLAAIQARPDNPKVIEYHMTYQACEAELVRRATVRSHRRMVQMAQLDPLAETEARQPGGCALNIGYRRACQSVNDNYLNRKNFDHACWSMGYEKRLAALNRFKTYAAKS